MKKYVIYGVLAALCWIGSLYGVYHFTSEYSFLEGIKAYHFQCYEVGGYIVGDTGEVVACMGQGMVPKEELHNFKSTI